MVNKDAAVKREHAQSGGLGELVRTLLYALVIALGIRTILFEPFNIPSGSMIPTLLVGDYLFVAKYSFGYSRFSLPCILPMFSNDLPCYPEVFSGRILESVPARGDVVVFKFPDDNKTDYIKRVIGLPGDRIQVLQGVLHINGQKVERRKIEDYVMRTGETLHRVPQYIETLPGGVSHPILEAEGDTAAYDNTEVFVVPAGHYFMMGDNRDNSADSRAFRNTFVPAENLVGKALFLFFSIEDSSILWLWEWPAKARFGRIFSAVH